MDTFSAHTTVYAEIKPTYRCNHRCPFCIWKSRKTLRPLTREQLTANLNTIKNVIRPSGVVLSGGEPLLYSGLQIILSKLAEMEFLQEFHLHTNATEVARVDPELLHRVAPRRSATVGIHGHTKRTYGVVSGSPNSFLKAREGIGLLKDLGFSLRASVVLCRHNYFEIPELTHFLLEEGFTWVELRLPILGPGMTGDGIFIEFAHAAPYLESWKDRYRGREGVSLVASGARCFETILFDPEEKIFCFFDVLHQLENCSKNPCQLASIWPEVFDGYKKGPLCSECLLSEDCKGYSAAEVRYGYAGYRPITLENVMAAYH